MGWTGTYRSYGNTAEAVVRDELESGGTWEVVARSGRYWAVRNRHTREIRAVVALVQVDRDMIWTKLIDETMGPVEANCPTHILNMLTDPAPSETAAEWRQRCRENQALRAAQPKLRPGDTIQTDQPITFTSGYTTDTLTFVSRYTFRTPDGRYAKLPKNWKQRYRWQIVARDRES